MQPLGANRDPGRGPRLWGALAVSLALHGTILTVLGPWSPPEPAPEPDPLRMVPLPPADETPETTPEAAANPAPRDRQAQGDNTTERPRAAPDVSPEQSPQEEAKRAARTGSGGAPEKGNTDPRTRRKPPAATAAKPQPAGEQDPAPPDEPAAGSEAETTAASESGEPDSPDTDYALYPSDGEAARWAKDPHRARASGAEAAEAQTATRASQRAAYLQSWLAKVQRLGHYPDEARERGTTGPVGLRVRIRPDGTLAEVTVRASSGHRILDRAAVETIRQGAPYSALPPALKAENPQGLTIEPALRYTRGGELISR